MTAAAPGTQLPGLAAVDRNTESAHMADTSVPRPGKSELQQFADLNVAVGG